MGSSGTRDAGDLHRQRRIREKGLRQWARLSRGWHDGGGMHVEKK
jgi:hypothetical protein